MTIRETAELIMLRGKSCGEFQGGDEWDRLVGLSVASIEAQVFMRTRAMRERAAKLADDIAATAIRALPVEEA